MRERVRRRREGIRGRLQQIRSGGFRGALSWVLGIPRRAWGRWRRLGRGAKVGLIGILILCAAGIAVRVWIMVAYQQGFIGFPDSSVYVEWAGKYGTAFGARKPAGYPLFLTFMHSISDHMSFTIAVQHVFGFLAGVLLYKSVRRTGAPPYLGLLPAAIVFFGSTGVLLEHSLLPESLFVFAQALGLYLAVRALGDTRVRWPLFAALAAGASFWLRTVGIASVVLVPVVLLFAAPGGWRRRALLGSVAALTGALTVFAYVYIQGATTGYWGYERQGAWNLYGRVATFVDCKHFHAPKGTAFLCPREALSHRKDQSFFQYNKKSPAVRVYGPPAGAPPQANAVLERFSVAAIEQQPIAYAESILGSLDRMITSQVGEGFTPEQLRDMLVDRTGVTKRPAITKFYASAHGAGTTGSIHSLVVYESHTRIQGAFLVALLAAAILGVPFLKGRARAASLLFTLTALLSAVLSVAGNRYDVRYAYPTFGLLGAGAGLGAWGIATRLRQQLSRGLRHVAARRARDAELV